MADDFKRITIRSLKDVNASGAYSIADYDKDIKAIERALKSALPKDAFYHMRPKEINYNDPTFHQIGKLREDFYIKEGYTNVAQQAIDQALGKMVFSGGTDPKYWSTRTRPVTDKENELIKELERINKEKNAEKETEATRFNRGTFLKILGAITGLADIARRILSSVLNIATQQVKETTEAHNLEISRDQMREYGRLETTHGLREGVISGAIADVQNKVGNITTLDEKTIEALAVVMGGKVSKLVDVATSENNPEKALGMIIDAFNERANSGFNSVGQYVGEASARRELYSYLLKLSPQWADIFATMQEEQHNINSLFRNQADTFAEWKNTIKPQRNTTQAGEGVLFTLGEEWNVFKALLDEIKHTLAVSIAPVLTRILRRLNNMRVGMNDGEKLRLNTENREANEKAIKETEASMEFLKQKSGGNINKLSKTERAYYDVLKEYKARLEEENTKKEIDNIVETPNELKVRQERWFTDNVAFYKDLIKSGGVDLDDPNYKGVFDFSGADIRRVIQAQGNNQFGEKAFSSYKNDYIQKNLKNKMDALRKTMGNQPEYLIKKQAESELEDEALKKFARTYYKTFYPILLGLQAEDYIRQSYNDQTYDIDRMREKYGANLEGLADILPKEALGTHRLISGDVKDENGVITHRIVLDVNDNGVIDSKDKILESWTGNERGGANGSQATITWDREKGITVNAQAGGASTFKNGG